MSYDAMFPHLSLARCVFQSAVRSSAACIAFLVLRHDVMHHLTLFSLPLPSTEGQMQASCYSIRFFGSLLGAVIGTGHLALLFCSARCSLYTTHSSALDCFTTICSAPSAVWLTSIIDASLVFLPLSLVCFLYPL
jgi:hypothetical protein